MLGRATVTLFTILIVAIANGALREELLKPQLGDPTAHILSALLLSVAVFLVARAAIGWIGPSGTRDRWSIGLFWLALTLAFEFLAGHYLFGADWSVLLADYELFRGRIWLAVLASTLLAPVLTAERLRQPPPVT